MYNSVIAWIGTADVSIKAWSPDRGRLTRPPRTQDGGTDASNAGRSERAPVARGAARAHPSCG